MKQEMVKVEPVALLPTPSGCAVFLGSDEKVILIYIDPSIGAAINMSLQQEKADGDVVFARLFLQVENELMERKIVELDARPSDSIALAVRDSAPIYVLKSVWSELNDVSGLLEDMKNSQPESDEDDDDEFNFDDDVPF
jgi:bifunctional DNase/RNase